MKNGRVFLLVVLALLMITFPAAAQGGSPLVAFVNGSGQLIVSSGDGSFRWIVTNPGETIDGDYRWSGNQLLFGVSQRGTTSLRAADPASQSVSEFGQTPGTLVSISPDARSVIYQQSAGSYGMNTVSGSSEFTLPMTNDQGAQHSGLWSDNGRLVAYWGYAGNSVLGVTSAATGETVTLDSGRSTPITPLAWRPGTMQLIYRDSSGFVRLADLACLPNGCAANPLDNGTALLPATANDIATDGNWVYYDNGSGIGAVNLDCASVDNCLDNPGTEIAANAAPQTGISVAGNLLIYTAYTQNPNDINDREVRALDLRCLGNPSSCAPQSILSGSIAGALSSSGRFAVIEGVSGGLSSLDLSSGTVSALSDGRGLLAGARWQ